MVRSLQGKHGELRRTIFFWLSNTYQALQGAKSILFSSLICEIEFELLPTLRFQIVKESARI